MNDCVDVHIRIKDVDNENIWSYKDGSLICVKDGKSRSFSCFNSVYLSKSTADFYTERISPVISRFKNMKDVTIMAYGQTGTGKTYTMSGENEDGLIYLTLRDIMPGSFTISYIEIYNEKVYDLKTAKELRVVVSGQDTRLIGIHVETVLSEGDAKRFLKECLANRKTYSTEYNLNSSRSHTIIQIKAGNAYLNFVDLAGSERMSSIEERRKEGGHINQSLLALGKVVSNLAAKKQAIYRESKLTRILQPSINPYTSIVAICMVSSSLAMLPESLSTIKFAARLRNIDLTYTETVLQQHNNDTKQCSFKSMKEHEGRGNIPGGYSVNSLLNSHPFQQTVEAIPDDISLWDSVPMDETSERGELLSYNDALEPLYSCERPLNEGTTKCPLLDIYEKRIGTLENMVKELLEKNPNKLMSEIFILERQMFVLRKQLALKNKKERLA